MFEYIQDAGLKPVRPYTKRAKTNLIILHHLASDATPETVHQYHISKGNKGIDYNIVVMLDGTAVWGRGIEYEGGHVLNSGITRDMNQRSIGIACQGNFSERTMPDLQKAMLFRVIRDCLKTYPIEIIYGHKDVKATTCPGAFFPLGEAKDLLNEPEPIAKPPTSKPPAAEKPPAPVPMFALKRLLKYTVPFMRGDDVKALQKALSDAGFRPSVIDGVFGKNTRSVVVMFQKAKKLKVDGVVGKITCIALGGKWTGK